MVSIDDSEINVKSAYEEMNVPARQVVFGVSLYPLHKRVDCESVRVCHRGYRYYNRVGVVSRDRQGLGRDVSGKPPYRPSEGVLHVLASCWEQNRCE